MSRNLVFNSRSMIAVVTLALVTACGGGGGSGGSVGAPAASSGSLSVSQTSLSFIGFTDVPADPATLTISDTRSNNYSWSGSIAYQTGSGWLKLNGNSIAAGQTVPAQQLAVTVDPASLSIGVHSASIAIAGNGETVTIPVSYTLTAPPISFAPTSVTITYSPGAVLPGETQVSLILSNPDGRPVNGGTVLVSDDNGSKIYAGWGLNAIQLLPPVSLTADASGTINLTVKYSLGLASGKYAVLHVWRDTTLRTFSVTLVCTDPNQPSACP